MILLPRENLLHWLNIISYLLKRSYPFLCYALDSSCRKCRTFLNLSCFPDFISSAILSKDNTKQKKALRKAGRLSLCNNNNTVHRGYVSCIHTPLAKEFQNYQNITRRHIYLRQKCTKKNQFLWASNLVLKFGKLVQTVKTINPRHIGINCIPKGDTSALISNFVHHS